MSIASIRRKTEKLAERVEEFAQKELSEGELRKCELPQRVLGATRDTFTWVTQFAKTFNEHWLDEGRTSPREHFPSYPYVQDVFEYMDGERVVWFEKSRDLMLSWACVAYLTLQAMKTPFRGVLFQTQKEDKVVQLIEYAKCLYKTQPTWLRHAFALEKPLNKQADLELKFANGSYIAGIPGGADKFAPTIRGVI